MRPFDPGLWIYRKPLRFRRSLIGACPNAPTHVLHRARTEDIARVAVGSQLHAELLTRARDWHA